MQPQVACTWALGRRVPLGVGPGPAAGEPASLALTDEPPASGWEPASTAAGNQASTVPRAGASASVCLAGTVVSWSLCPLLPGLCPAGLQVKSDVGAVGQSPSLA